MSWWIAIAVLLPGFMTCMFTSFLYYAKAMSAAHPRVAVKFGGNLDNQQYWKMLNSKKPLVIHLRKKYRTFIAISICLGAGIVTCMFNAPAPKIN